MQLADYKRKFLAWAGVYMLSDVWDVRSDSGLMRFKTNFNLIYDWVNTLELPEESDADGYCILIEQEAEKISSDEFRFREAWRYIHLKIVKSACLSRLLYCNEDLRTRPCPTHTGHWNIEFHECLCLYPGTCCATGWLPDND